MHDMQYYGMVLTALPFFFMVLSMYTFGSWLSDPVSAPLRATG